jgi:transposase
VYVSCCHEFERRLSPTMRQHHVAASRRSGKTMQVVDRVTGEIRPAQLFVLVLGPSN